MPGEQRDWLSFICTCMLKQYWMVCLVHTCKMRLKSVMHCDHTLYGKSVVGANRVSSDDLACIVEVSITLWVQESLGVAREFGYQHPEWVINMFVQYLKSDDSVRKNKRHLCHSCALCTTFYLRELDGYDGCRYKRIQTNWELIQWNGEWRNNIKCRLPPMHSQGWSQKCWMHDNCQCLCKSFLEASIGSLLEDSELDRGRNKYEVQQVSDMPKISNRYSHSRHLRGLHSISTVSWPSKAKTQKKISNFGLHISQKPKNIIMQNKLARNIWCWNGYTQLL